MKVAAFIWMKRRLHCSKRLQIRCHLRIFPIYYLFISVIILGLPHVSEIQNNAVWYYTYTSNLLLFLKQSYLSKLLNHTWSLSVEEQFYLLWPFLVLFIKRKYEIWLFILVIFSAPIFRLTFQYLGLWDYTLLSSYLDCLAGGGLLAYLQLNEKKLNFDKMNHYNRYVKLVTMVLWVLVIILHYQNLKEFKAFLNLLYSTTGCLSIYLLTKHYNEKWNFIFRNRPLVFIGKISYGLYIYHKIIPWAFSILAAKLNMKISSDLYLNYLFYWMILLPLTLVSWRLFEQPINNLKRHFSYTDQEEKIQLIH